jgi:hypothetical protein
MPLTGDPATATISGKVMFLFDTDFKAASNQTLQQTQDAYIHTFRNNVIAFWETLTFNGLNVKVAVTFEHHVTGANGWTLTVGHGEGTLAKAFFAPTDVTATEQISFVQYAQETGYMFQSHNASEAPHEFGHMVRLADRYVNGILADYKQPLADRFSRTTAPLSRCFSKELDLEASATTGAPYDAFHNLMSRDTGNASTVTNRQLGFVFSTTKEPVYSVNGWVYLAKQDDRNEPDGQAIWLGTGVTSVKKRAGITHRVTTGPETVPCDKLTPSIQYFSFRPLLFGLRYQANDEDRNHLHQTLITLGPDYRKELKRWVRAISAMNP